MAIVIGMLHILIGVVIRATTIALSEEEEKNKTSVDPNPAPKPQPLNLQTPEPPIPKTLETHVGCADLRVVLIVAHKEVNSGTSRRPFLFSETHSLGL